MKYYEKEMNTIHPTGCVGMTWEDAEAVEKINADNGWGISFADSLRMIADHMEANEKRTTSNEPDVVMNAHRVMEMVEWRLTDANFHSLAHFLHSNNYEGAIKFVTEDYFETEVK